MVVTPIIRAVHSCHTAPSTLFQRVDSPFLFEGSENGWFDGEYSLIGLSPFAVFQSDPGETRFTPREGKEIPSVWKGGDPLALLQHCVDRFQPDLQTLSLPNISQNLPFLYGGAVGFISYDLIRQYEPIPSPVEENRVPDIYMAFINHFILIHHVKAIYYIVYNPAPLILLGVHPEEAFRIGEAKIETVFQKLTAPQSEEEQHLPSQPLTIQNALSEGEYGAMVKRAQAYIAAGDIYQANLAQSFHAPFYGPSLFPLYRRLRQINPSPFSAYLNVGGIEMAGASPERLLRIKAGAKETMIETRPLAGTRPRGKTVEEDQDQMTTLFGSEKERAEHLMLVDLERNDIGKVSQFGSVKVDALLALTRCSHVFHLVSNIVGTLCASVRPTDALRALFPGGTITGVPKIRCMQIIAELEKSPRGLYTGSVGYLDFAGDCDMNIVIRTFIRRGEALSFHVGAGIVADSDPAMEYQETLHKAAALFAALKPS